MSKLKTDIEKAVMKAVLQLANSKGSSIADIQQYLLSKKLLSKVPDAKSIQLCVNTAVDKGLLVKLPNGRYKMKETGSGRRSRSRSRSKRKPNKTRSRSGKRSASRKPISNRKRRERSPSTKPKSRRRGKTSEKSK